MISPTQNSQNDITLKYDNQCLVFRIWKDLTSLLLLISIKIFNPVFFSHRFDFHRMMGKITRHVNFPEKLNIRPYMSIKQVNILGFQNLTNF